MIDAFIADPTLMRVRFARWDDLLRQRKPAGKPLASTALWHWARALAY
jgi:hypothetical protein